VVYLCGSTGSNSTGQVKGQARVNEREYSDGKGQANSEPRLRRSVAGHGENFFLTSQASLRQQRKRGVASLGGSVIPRTLWGSAMSKLRGPSPEGQKLE
jgi:hypothetical protein